MKSLTFREAAGAVVALPHDVCNQKDVSPNSEHALSARTCSDEFNQRIDLSVPSVLMRLFPESLENLKKCGNFVTSPSTQEPVEEKKEHFEASQVSFEPILEVSSELNSQSSGTESTGAIFNRETHISVTDVAVFILSPANRVSDRTRLSELGPAISLLKPAAHAFSGLEISVPSIKAVVKPQGQYGLWVSGVGSSLLLSLNHRCVCELPPTPFLKPVDLRASLVRDICFFMLHSNGLF